MIAAAGRSTHQQGLAPQAVPREEMHVDKGGKGVGEEERLHDADGDHKHLPDRSRAMR